MLTGIFLSFISNLLDIFFFLGIVHSAQKHILRLQVLMVNIFRVEVLNGSCSSLMLCMELCLHFNPLGLLLPLSNFSTLFDHHAPPSTISLTSHEPHHFLCLSNQVLGVVQHSVPPQPLHLLVLPGLDLLLKQVKWVFHYFLGRYLLLEASLRQLCCLWSLDGLERCHCYFAVFMTCVSEQCFY